MDETLSILLLFGVVVLLLYTLWLRLNLWFMRQGRTIIVTNDHLDGTQSGAGCGVGALFVLLIGALFLIGLLNEVLQF